MLFRGTFTRWATSVLVVSRFLAHRADVEWAVGHYSREVELYEATPTNPDAVSAASHLRHWQGILAAIDAFEGVAA